MPIVPQDSWSLLDRDGSTSIMKTYRFDTLNDRNEFVTAAIDIEAERKHCSVMTLDELLVRVELFTRTLRMATELDRELATYLDEVYCDIASSAALSMGSR